MLSSKINIIQVYAPTADANEETIDRFYDDLEQAKRQCKASEVMIVMGDMNARVGEQRMNNTVGPHGLGTINERGERWAEWCTSNDQVIMNTWFQMPKRRK